jgi:hypothetical protein
MKSITLIELAARWKRDAAKPLFPSEDDIEKHSPEHARLVGIEDGIMEGQQTAKLACAENLLTLVSILEGDL